MHKGIYLNVQVAVDSPLTAAAAGKMEKAAPEHVAQVKQAVQEAMKQGTPSAGLTGDIKRVRPGKDPNHVEVLVFVEGEQAAPENFVALATSEVQKTLETVFQKPTLGGVKASVKAIEENPNAVDELADEADAQAAASAAAPNPSPARQDTAVEEELHKPPPPATHESGGIGEALGKLGDALGSILGRPPSDLDPSKDKQDPDKS